MTFVVPFPGLAKVTRAFLSANAVASSNIGHTFASLNFGGTSADRYMLAFIGFQGSAAGSIAGCTIGGVSGTEISALNVTGIGTGTTKGKTYIASVPSGTSGDLVVSVSSAAASRYSYALYALFGLGSTTPFDTGTATTNPMTKSLNIPERGVGIAASFDSTSATNTWSGLTEDSDGIASSTYVYTSASLEANSAQTGLLVSCTATAANAPTFMALSFGP